MKYIRPVILTEFVESHAFDPPLLKASCRNSETTLL
jgi:hypothetical protein